jgi:release factor glutamine methyltransferase
VLLVETSPAQAGLTTGAMAAAGLATEVVVDAEIGGCVALGVRVSR